MIQTVTGPVNKGNFGCVLMHEHISCSSMSFAQAFGTAWLDKEGIKALSVDVLKLMREKYDLGLFVDGTPMDLGRDVLLLRDVSQLSGVKIVASTGFYHFSSAEALSNQPIQLAKWLMKECTEGIGNTGIKPGILKCATGNEGITEDNRKKLSVMGIVQRESNLPLFVHCEHNGNVAFEQIALLMENGANPEKIIIGHSAHRADAEYLSKIIKMGCYVCVDQCHIHDLAEIAQALVSLCQKGYTHKLLIANDRCIHSDFTEFETNGLQLTAAEHTEKLGYVLTDLYQQFIAAGGKAEDWQTMVKKNPIAILDV